MTANGRLQASYSAAMVVGPLLAGVLVAVVDLETVFLVDSASFVASAVSLGLVRTSLIPTSLPSGSTSCATSARGSATSSATRSCETSR